MPGNHPTPTHEIASKNSNGGWLLLALLSAVAGFSGVLFGQEILTIAGLLGGITASTGLSLSRRTTNTQNSTPQHLLVNLSHEIRTPISAILGFAELLEEAKPHERSSYLRTIEHNSEHVLRLLDNVLNHARFEAGECTTISIETNVRSLAQETSDTFAPLAKKKGLVFSVHIEPRTPLFIATDPTRLRQVLCNVLANAIKFTSSGKVALFLDYRRDTTELICKVTDTGIGIPSHALTRIFRAFQQANGETGQQHGGTGLGLHISQEIAEALGGSLTVESEEGTGSAFTLRIHAPETSPTHAPALSNAEFDFNGRSILVAEDCPDNRRLLSCLLAQYGARVIEVDNGQEALQQARSRQAADLVILDMNMPVMDGRETTRRLRREGYSGPILALTAHASPSDHDACMAAGCTAFLAKPIRRTAFQSVVFRLLAGDSSPRLAG